MNEYVIAPKEANKDIEKVIDSFIQLFETSHYNESIISIYMGGGFGRGEGSVIKEKNLYVALNDYDLFAIYTGNIKSSEYERYFKSLNVHAGMEHVDVELVPLTKIMSYIYEKKLSQSIYDLLLGSVCIWKNQMLPEYSNFLDVALQDCIRNQYLITTRSCYDVLRTRLWCVIAPMKYSKETVYFDMTYKNHTFRCMQLIKACTAILDAVLIVEKKYTSPKFSDKIILFLHSEFAKLFNEESKFVVLIVEKKLKNNVKFEYFNNSTAEKIVTIYSIAIDYCVKKSLFNYFYYWFRTGIGNLCQTQKSKKASLSVNKMLKNTSLYYKKLNMLAAFLRCQYDKK